MPETGVLIDTGGLDKLLDPDTHPLRVYWGRFEKQAVHFVSSIAYWEFLNGHDTHSPIRKLLQKRIAEGCLNIMPFAQAEAEEAARIYRTSEVQKLMSEIPKSRRRQRLQPLQCDIFIAATARCCRPPKRIFTMDIHDWRFLQKAVQELGVQPLDVDFGVELEPPGKRRPRVD